MKGPRTSDKNFKDSLMATSNQLNSRKEYEGDGFFVLPWRIPRKKSVDWRTDGHGAYFAPKNNHFILPVSLDIFAPKI